MLPRCFLEAGNFQKTPVPKQAQFPENVSAFGRASLSKSPYGIFFQTCTVFHFPLLKSRSVNIPTEVSEMNTPQNTPECCHPNCIARR